MMLALSRPLMFSTTVARPDLLCVLCGALATMVLFRNTRNSFVSVRTAAIVGGLCGLGALFHPFALVFAMQSSVLMLFDKDTVRQRLLKLMCYRSAASRY